MSDNSKEDLIEKINELTKENIQLKSQLQIANEKESMQKLTVEKIKQIQSEYEASYLSSISDYKSREANMKNQYFQYQSMLENQYKQSEKRLTDQIAQLKKINQKTISVHQISRLLTYQQ